MERTICIVALDKRKELGHTRADYDGRNSPPTGELQRTCDPSPYCEIDTRKYVTRLVDFVRFYSKRDALAVLLGSATIFGEDASMEAQNGRCGGETCRGDVVYSSSCYFPSRWTRSSFHYLLLTAYCLLYAVETAGGLSV